jgi:hypothetical protein
MKPRRRRHNRIARKKRRWLEAWGFTAKRMGGTFSNMPSGEPITDERLRAAIEEVRAMMADRSRPIFRFPLYAPLPPHLFDLFIKGPTR